MPAEMDAQQLPIDISYSKLADWLVDRRRIPADWRKKLAQIRSRISSSFSSLPKDADPWFLTLNPEAVGYLEAKRIRDILVKTMPEGRTVFGRLAGIAGEWDAIVRAYEKEHVHLGEAAQIMIQNVNYEIPFQKKHIAKVQQQLGDLERKEAEFKRNASASAARYQQSCQELGISGKNIRSELLASVNTLPKIFTDLGEILHGESVEEALKLYSLFVAYAHSELEDEAMTTLQTLRDARSSSFEVSDDLPSTIHTKSSIVEDAEKKTSPEEEEPAEIQWDIDLPESTEKEVSGQPQNEGEAQEIQWDIDLPESTEEKEVSVQPQNEEAHGIQWDINLGDALAEGEAAETKTQEGEVSEIVWDIDLEELEKRDEQLQESAGTTGSGGDEIIDAVPRSRLLDMNYRNNLLNDLFEMKAFLGQRVQELENTETVALQSQMQAVAPAVLQQYGVQVLNQMGAEVAKAIHLLTNSRTRDLLLILTSPRFLDRLESSLQQKKQNELKSLDGLKDLEHRRIELRNAISSSWPKQEELVNRTKQIKENVEQCLSQMYDGRIVNIIGEINMLV